MKKGWTASLVVLFACHLVIPLCKGIGVLFGYAFTLYAPLPVAIVLCVLSLAAAVCLLFSKPVLKTAGRVAVSLLLPLSFVNAFCFLSKDLLPLLCVGICCICALVVFIKFAGPTVLKVVMGILAVLFFLLLGFILGCIIMGQLFVNGFSEETLRDEMKSPQNTYTAALIDSDQGALGGNTRVYVQNERNKFSLLIGEFKKPAVQLYVGGYLENVQMQWRDDHTLLINGEEYDVNEF